MKILTSIALLFCLNAAIAQIERPVTWTFESRPSGEKDAVLVFTAKIEPGWHLYSQFIEEGGPRPTTFSFTPSDDYVLNEGVVEKSKVIKSFDAIFEMDIAWFENESVFEQKVTLKAPSTTIKGTVEFMVCNDEKCLPPDEVEFSIPVSQASGRGRKSSPQKDERMSSTQKTPVKEAPATAVEKKKPEVTEAPKEASADSKIESSTRQPETQAVQVAEKAAVTEERKADAEVSTIVPVAEKDQQRSLLGILIAGFFGGLAAIVMPCIFPMLPFTVSYFTKRGTTRKNAVGIALLYGVSIIVIYVTLGLLVTVLFGSDALNELSTNGIFNFFFFLLLVIFGASFLGAFEITLPSSWVNKADAGAEKKGFVGIFFMAFTLALVSFSCTGPIIGTLLVEAATMGQMIGPAVGMFGFSVALALPFTLFSMFPSWLNSLPKSGGWLNSVKVTLGFLELALALKFLSNVDLAYHWEWFDREVFLVLWIIIFGMLGFYLLGKLKFPHDSELQHISPVRLFLAIITLSFSLYMIPGLWGAPLKAIAAFLPPQQTQDFDLYSQSLAVRNAPVQQAATKQKKRYEEIFHAPYGLDAFFDYEEGMEYARAVNKPVLIDFTGHACVNCRKMEAVVWSDPQVLKRLRDDYVLIQLYVDDRTELPEEEKTVSAFSGKRIKTLGNKWSDFQASVYRANSQPYYVLLHPNGTLLAEPQGANYSVENFTRFLDEGLRAFRGGLGG